MNCTSMSTATATALDPTRPGYANMLNQGDPNAGAGGPLSQYLNWDQYNFVGERLWRDRLLHHGTQCLHVLLRQRDARSSSATSAMRRHSSVGGQYVFDFGLTVNGIFERMTRKLPAALEFQNERQRNGTWLAVTQTLTPRDNVNLGWAHAGRTPGDPGGQHNYNPNNSDNHGKHVHVRVQAPLRQAAVLAIPTLPRPSTAAMRTTIWVRVATASRPTATMARPRPSSTTPVRAIRLGAAADPRRFRWA